MPSHGLLHSSLVNECRFETHSYKSADGIFVAYVVQQRDLSLMHLYALMHDSKDDGTVMAFRGSKPLPGLSLTILTIYLLSEYLESRKELLLSCPSNPSSSRFEVENTKPSLAKDSLLSSLVPADQDCFGNEL